MNLKSLKRILAASILSAAILTASVLPVSAEHYWSETNEMKFSAANGTINVDGAISPGEWDDAQAINITLNNNPLWDSNNINYQGEWDGDRKDDDYSGVYKIKWDANYIYFLEDRNDNHINLSSNASQPWTADGGLIFTQVDSADGKTNPDGISAHIFYTVGEEGKIGGSLRARVANMYEHIQEVVEIPGGLIKSALKTGGVITEIAVPWSFYSEIVPKFKANSVAGGDKMGLSFVIHDSDTDEAGFVKQLCYAIDNDNMGDVDGGYDYGGWGTLELSAGANAVNNPAPAIAEPTPIIAVEEPAQVQTQVTAPVVINAPITGDNNLFVTIGAIATAIIGGCFAFGRKNKVR